MKQEPAESALVKTKPELVGIHRPFSKGGEFLGLGVALSAFGVEHGTFVAHAIIEKLDENSNPWSAVDHVFRDPGNRLPGHLATEIGATLREKWKNLPEQWKKWHRSNGFPRSREPISVIRTNASRNRTEPISVTTVDRGLFPDAVARDRHPVCCVSDLVGLPRFDGRV